MARDFVTQAELEAALEALRTPGRFDTAERLVGQVAPGLYRILIEALGSGGWNSEDDAREIDKALAANDAAAVRDSLGALLGEQTRVACWLAWPSASSWHASSTSIIAMVTSRRSPSRKHPRITEGQHEDPLPRPVLL